MISYQILSRKKKKRSKYIYSKFNTTLIFIKQIWLIELWQNVLKKKNQGHLTQKPIFTYLCIYLYANIEFPSYRNQYWQHLLQQGLFWQNFISPIYFTLLIASSHLAKNPSCFALLKLLHCLPSSLLLPNNHPSINQILCSPCKAPQGSIPYHDSVYWSLGSMFPSRDQFVPMYPNFQLTGQTKWASSLNFKTQAW